MPELTPGSGQFPHSRARIVEDGKTYYFDSANVSGASYFKPPCFDDYDRAFAALYISLVMQTLTAFERVGIDKGYELYVEGGFRKDECYCSLLASALPDNRVFLTDITEASALGAAMTAKMALSGKSLAELSGDFEVSYQEQEKDLLPELEAYRQVWVAEAG